MNSSVHASARQALRRAANTRLGRGLAQLTVLLGLCFWIYAPALSGRPLWDDNDALFGNPLITSPVARLGQIWFTHAAPDYWPLHYSYFWLAWRLFGPLWWAYHSINIALHALNAFLLGQLASRLGARWPYLVSLLFAAHPVNVEAVAWIVQFKSVASTTLALGSCLAYLRAQANATAARPASAELAAAFAFFALSLLVKTTYVFIPLILLTYSYCKGADRRFLARLIPLVVVAALLAAVSATWYPADGDLPSGERLDLGSPLLRLARAGYNLASYVRLALWPHPLLFIYPKHALDQPATLATGSLLVALAVGTMWVAMKRAPHWISFPLLYFFLALIPVSGVFGIYFMRYSDYADHWLYAALPAVLWLVAAGLAHLPPWLGRVMGLGLVATAATLAHAQATLYRDEESLWRATARAHPGAWVAHNNLGKSLMDQGLYSSAESEFSAALALKPDFRDALTNLGALRLAQHQPAEALSELNRAAAITRDDPVLESNLGVALTRLGRLTEAESHLRRATTLAPDDASYHKNLGYTLHHRGQLKEAAAEYQRATELQPRADYLNDLGQVLREAGQLPMARQALEQALALDRGHALAMANLGLVYRDLGDLPTAEHWLDQAAAASPKTAAIHLALASLLVERRESPGAERELALALQLDPQVAGSAAVAAQLAVLKHQR